MLGRLTLNASKSSNSLLNSIESSIKGGVNDLIADVARELNIHDFYSAHLLDYCEVGPPNPWNALGEIKLNSCLLGLLHPWSHRQCDC